MSTQLPSTKARASTSDEMHRFGDDPGGGSNTGADSPEIDRLVLHPSGQRSGDKRAQKREGRHDPQVPNDSLRLHTVLQPPSFAPRGLYTRQLKRTRYDTRFANGPERH